jgi:putative thioredoxin
MAESKYICEITSIGEFEEKVLKPSFGVPVLVDFWAAWCQPCQMLMPLLGKLAEEFQGKFLLVKVNSDEQQALATQYGVRSLPTVKFFRDGAIVDEFMGAQPESAIRALLDKYVVRDSDLVREQARKLREAGQLDQTLDMLKSAAGADPDNPRVRVDLMSVLIEAKRYDDADALYADLPFAEKESDAIKALLAELSFHRQAGDLDDLATLMEGVKNNPGDLSERLRLAAQLVVGGRLEDAMDQYIEVMKRDRTFQDEAGRKGLLEVFTLLGADHPAVNTYRRKMFALLH